MNGKIKKILATLLGVIVAFGAFVGCQDKESSTQQEVQQKQRKQQSCEKNINI